MEHFHLCFETLEFLHLEQVESLQQPNLYYLIMYKFFDNVQTNCKNDITGRLDEAETEHEM